MFYNENNNFIGEQYGLVKLKIFISHFFYVCMKLFLTVCARCAQ